MRKIYWKITVFIALMLFLIGAFAAYSVLYFNGGVSGGSNFPDSNTPSIEKGNKQFIKQSEDYYQKNIQPPLNNVYSNYLENGYKIDLVSLLKQLTFHGWRPCYLLLPECKSHVEDWWKDNYSSIFSKIPLIEKHFSFVSDDHSLDKAVINFLSQPTDNKLFDPHNENFDNKWSLADLVWSYIDLVDLKKNVLPDFSIVFTTVNINEAIRTTLQSYLDKWKSKFDGISYIPENIKKIVDPYFDLGKIDLLVEGLWKKLDPNGDQYLPDQLPDPDKINYSIQLGFNNLTDAKEPTPDMLDKSVQAAIKNFIFDTLWSKKVTKNDVRIKNLLNLPIPNDFGLNIYYNGDQWPTGMTISATLINTLLHNYFQLTYTYDWMNDKEIQNGKWGFVIGGV